MSFFLDVDYSSLYMRGTEAENDDHLRWVLSTTIKSSNLLKCHWKICTEMGDNRDYFGIKIIIKENTFRTTIKIW